MLLPKIRRPEAMSNAFAALGEALRTAGEDPSLRQPLIDLLCVRFSDIFYWHAGSCRLAMASKVSLVDFVTRSCANAEGHELTVRPTQRFVDIILALADLTGGTVDFTEGWPVITPAVPTD